MICQELIFKENKLGVKTPRKVGSFMRILIANKYLAQDFDYANTLKAFEPWICEKKQIDVDVDHCFCRFIGLKPGALLEQKKIYDDFFKLESKKYQTKSWVETHKNHQIKDYSYYDQF